MTGPGDLNITGALSCHALPMTKDGLPGWPRIIAQMGLSLLGLAVLIHQLFRKPLKRVGP